MGVVRNKIIARTTFLAMDKSKAARLVVAFTGAVLLVVPSLFKLDGTAHANWQQFLGRFHPLVVHVPIGLILLIPLLEVAGTFRPALREAASFVLALSVLGCLAGVTLGYLLAYGSGTTGTTVSRHMWGGIALSIGVLICWLLRPAWALGASRGGLSSAYPTALVSVLILLSVAAHLGGSITHGDNYLLEYLPESFKRLTGLAVTPPKTLPAAGSFYAEHIFPALDSHCAACHNDKKVKGRLRVDSYEALLKGGQGGPAVVPGMPDKSLLLQRVTLSKSHPKFMPADGKTPLKDQDIELVRAWIVQGASPTVKTLAGISLPDKIVAEPLPQVADYSRLLQSMKEVAKSQGVTLTQLSSNPGDGLVLNTIDAAPSFSDTQLAQFEPFAPYIVEVQLGRTSVTDASFATLAKFTHLRSLHLESTGITGNGLARLGQLFELTYLNLSETHVTAAAAVQLQSSKMLHHLYLFNTPAQPISKTKADPVPRKT